MFGLGESRRAALNRRDLRILVIAWAAASVGRAVIALWMPVPQILTDELRFEGIAADIAHGRISSPWSTFHEYPSSLYPLLLSPFYRLPPEIAYRCAKAFNAFLACSVVFPVWGLARKVLSRRWAISVSILSLSLPGLGYASTLMAENLFAPLFMVTLVVFLSWSKTPPLRAILGLGMLLGALILTKTQGVLLLPVFALAPLLPAFRGEGRDRAKSVAATALAAFVAGLLVLANGYLRFGSALWSRFFQPHTWLGYYAKYLHPPVSRHGYAELTNWAYNLAATSGEFGLGVGLVAFVAAADLGFNGRRRTGLLLGPIVLGCWILATRTGVDLAVYFDSPHFVYERYTTHLAPLFLIALASMLSREPTAFRRAILVSSLIGIPLVAWTALSAVDEHLINDAPGLAWFQTLEHGHIAPVIVLVTLCVAAAYFFMSRKPVRLAIAAAFVLGATSLGFASAQHNWAAYTAWLNLGLVPFAQRLHATGADIHVLVDRLPTNEVWQAEFFVGEGENNAISLEASPFAHQVSVSDAGELVSSPPLEIGNYVITDSSIHLEPAPVAVDGRYIAYKIDRTPLRLLEPAR